MVRRVQAPQQAQPPDHYIYDPEDPTPTLGGSIVSQVYRPGSVDVSRVQQRSDVLSYTTAPLETDLDVVGPLRLILYASSSAVDTDFAARLRAQGLVLGKDELDSVYSLANWLNEGVVGLAEAFPVEPEVTTDAADLSIGEAGRKLRETAAARRRLDAEADRLTAWADGFRVPSVYRTPAMRGA